MIFEILNSVSEKDEICILDIACKSEYIILTKESLKRYANDKFHKVAVIKEKNVIKGFLIYFILPPDIDIIFIASYPNSKGYGSFLLDNLAEEAGKNKVLRITLDLHEKNHIAKAFYERNGFLILAKRERYYENYYDAIIMEKLL